MRIGSDRWEMGEGEEMGYNHMGSVRGGDVSLFSFLSLSFFLHSCFYVQSIYKPLLGYDRLELSLIKISNLKPT